MRALVRGCAATFIAFAAAIAGACVVENGPPPPYVPPPRGLAVDARPAAAEAATEAATPKANAATADAASDDAPARAAVDGVRPPGPAFVSCSADSDCVAVPRNGCCDNGYKEAVNAKQVEAYRASFVCPEPRPICPMFRIRDERRPACNPADHTCELLQR